MDALLHALKSISAFVFGHLGQTLFSFGSTFSAASLAAALVLALASLAWARMSRRRAVRLRTLMRALLPRRFLRHPSTRADVGLALFNIFAAGVLFTWMLLSTDEVSRTAAAGLARAFGPAHHPALDPTVGRTIATVVLFLSYELAYWVDHALSHKIPMLWAFHKVHHTAELLTPLTVFRVHPVDSLVFANITAAIVGVAGGVLHYAFGSASAPAVISGTNVIMVAFVFLTIHLQHSHFWISFTGLAGRIFLSPAHHQIHHSANPAHFNRNFGCCLSVWDWAFGTLCVPARRREVLRFGADLRDGAPSPHSVSGVLIEPFEAVWRGLPETLRPPIAARSGAAPR
jgi:sterol desaturase/sphingolipid hydroxylase (fatty acid hydroxylase superfamily)